MIGTPAASDGDPAAAPQAAAPQASASDIVAFLRSAAARLASAGRVGDPGRRADAPFPLDDVRIVETNMSWVFLAGDRVLKLKKAVRRAFLDFSTLALREFYCREEVRLNSRLAPGVYLGVLAVQRADGGFALVDGAAPAGDRPTVDWVVLMRRLPGARMLDRVIADGALRFEDVDALAAMLCAFYRAAPAVALAPKDYVARLEQEQAVNRMMLCSPQLGLAQAPRACDRFDRALHRHAAALGERALRGHIVDGHGDLRLEHVALLEPPVVIDCLEFSASLRQVDPFDELAFLALEFDAAGVPWAGERLLETCRASLADPPAPGLVQLYRAYRALVRGRLAIAHLLERSPRTPQRWAPLATRYLEHALRALDCADPGDCYAA